MRVPVVLDKSYLQGSSRAHMHALVESHQLLMSEALLYELLSKPEDYRRCFSKFPSVESPVDLVPHVGGYIRKEVHTRRPAPRPSERIEPVRFTFNPRLLDSSFALADEARAEIERQRQELIGDVRSLKARALAIPQFFPDLFTPDGIPRAGARAEAEGQVSSPRALIDFIGNLRAPKGIPKFPPKRIITNEWAIYRWLQVQVLFALDLYVRFGGMLEGSLSFSQEEAIEHDVLDAHYLLVGVHEGGFATHERKLQRWFKLLRPDGVLLQQDG